MHCDSLESGFTAFELIIAFGIGVVLFVLFFTLFKAIGG